MAATIADVAALAGCSITTVSRAFSRPDKLRPETLERIRRAATSLQYSPNAIARAMVTQRNRTIAFVISEKHYPVSLNPFYAAVAESVQQQAEQLGYTVIIVSSRSANASDTFMRKRVDGAILAGQTDQELLHSLLQQGLPIVFLNNQVDLPGTVSVTSDDYGGAVSAIEHLISRGHRRIGLISGRLFPYIAASRYRAYLDTMAAHGLPVDPRLTREVEPHPEDALRCVSELLQSDDRPSALFCMNDSLAIGAIKAALRAGLRVPQDLAVVGYDGSSVCTVIEPELTSVSVDTAQMGAIGAKRLIRLIAGTDEGEPHVQLKSTLVVRGST